MSGTVLDISVDRSRCICSEYCTENAPQTFTIGDDYVAEVLPGPHDDAATVAKAVNGCPTGALSARETPA